MLVAMTNNNFHELGLLREENKKLRKALEERKIIEKAKGILMKKKGVKENEAYRTIQKLSMDKRKKMWEIAEAVILAEEVGSTSPS